MTGEGSQQPAQLMYLLIFVCRPGDCTHSSSVKHQRLSHVLYVGQGTGGPDNHNNVFFFNINLHKDILILLFASLALKK